MFVHGVLRALVCRVRGVLCAWCVVRVVCRGSFVWGVYKGGWACACLLVSDRACVRAWRKQLNKQRFSDLVKSLWSSGIIWQH